MKTYRVWRLENSRWERQDNMQAHNRREVLEAHRALSGQSQNGVVKVRVK